MATIVLSAVGAAIGGSLGGSIFGLSSVVIGRAVGAAIGNYIDQSLMGTGSQVVETGRVDRFRLSSASEGLPVAEVYGRTRISGQIIWASRFKENVTTTPGSNGGKGGGGQPATPTVREYSYSVSLAIGLCEGEIERVGRIWADGLEISRTDIDMRVYKGTETQAPDPKIAAVEGSARAPAYRGLAYAVIEDLDLSQFGNRVPQFSFEVIRHDPGIDDAPDDVSRSVRAVALMPGTGEYALATTRVHLDEGLGKSSAANVNSPGSRPDLKVSLDSLRGELPKCKSVSLIISWFGDDLRVNRCSLRPKVEQKKVDGAEMPWKVSGLRRSTAERVAELEGRPVYGGTPSDQSVIEAIHEIRDRIGEVMFYPFILMEQLSDNGLRDPYTGDQDQPVLPWRGRITTSVAPGRAGTPDKTSEALGEVEAFFGQAKSSDFLRAGNTVDYIGPNEFSYRRFILHYAHLCALAGGVDAFCIGSEMRGLTQIRDGRNSFPAVRELRRLAGEVREILGPNTKIGYAADWSEYFGYHPQDGSGDVLFHLDPLWSDVDIDFIGIDNYMPLSDWRDGYDHADADWGAIYNLEYLKANIAGGEGFEWFYHAPEAAALQIRTPITDGAHDEPWVFRYKDLRGWWENTHHDRLGGVREPNPTNWVPQSKPFWFTELGCAAIDKGTNQPNKFLDPKSSESARPAWSNGRRDDLIQMQYLRAMEAHWSKGSNNPKSDRYDGRMLDTSKSFAWAWDARPYPFFPTNLGLWSDGENYTRGHWLNGRSTNRTLESVVREICRKAGVSSVDVSQLHGLVRGYSIAEGSSARAALQPLMLTSAFDAIERDGKLIWKSRTGRVDGNVELASIVDAREETGRFEETRMPEAELAGRVRLSFVEADGDFDLRASEAAFPDDRITTTSQTEVPLVLTSSEAGQITERWLAESRVARDRVRFSLAPSQLATGAGDVVRIDGREDLYRIDSVEQGAFSQIEAVRIEPTAYVPSPDKEIVRRPRKFVRAVPVDPVFLDLPLLTGEEVPHAPHISVAAEPWRGPVAVYSSRTANGFRLNTLVEVPGTIGITENPLMVAKPGLWDRGPSLRVRFARNDVASASLQDVLAGVNGAAIGSGTDDVWEVFQFSRAELVAEDTFELSMRLRGQAGTDGVMPAIWPAGSLVVLLGEERIRQLAMGSSLRGIGRSYRVGLANRPIDDPAYVQEERAFDGIGLRPYAPSHLRAYLRENGDTVVRWIRRTRIDGDVWSSTDVPLGEALEAYVVRVISSGGAIVREATVPMPEWIYLASARIADGVNGAITIEVAQVSEKFGPGAFKRVRLNV